MRSAFGFGSTLPISCLTMMLNYFHRFCAALEWARLMKNWVFECSGEGVGADLFQISYLRMTPT